MATASYFQSISIWHWNCTLLAYFNAVTLISPLPWTSCLVLCLETINDNGFIFSGHIKLTWDLHTVILTFFIFVLEIMTFDFKLYFLLKFTVFVLHSVLHSSICCTCFINPTFSPSPKYSSYFFSYVQLIVVLFVQVLSIHHIFFLKSNYYLMSHLGFRK